ncbi:MAG: DEAD/DEAH box helicase [Spirochaetota bacterium]|nr:DEAD/DEAH box helicase [Spirochaetota bacterium]
MKFNEFNIDKNILKGIDEAGFSECMPVQEKTFAYTLVGKDVCVQSQTGTGKTAAFLISIFHLLLNDKSFSGKKALIITPTRELSVQIEKDAKLLGLHLDFIIGSFYGGVGYTLQEKLLRDGVNIMIGTPGRLIDLNQSGKLNFKDIGILIIDEADRLFDMGFFPDIKKMINRMPTCSSRLTMLFSATLDQYAKDLAWKYMKDPVEIILSSEQITVENMTHELYHVGKDEKMSLLLGILKKEKPKNVLIFTNTKHSAVEVSKRLEFNGYKCQYIIGDLPQMKRLKIIEGIKSGEILFLTATDVAARGLHINDLELVINYDLPQHSENYVHRIGRTARAGKSGKAISLACEKYVYSLHAIESYANMKIPVEWPSDDLFEKDMSIGISITSKNISKKGRKPVRKITHEKSTKPAHNKNRYTGAKQTDTDSRKKEIHNVPNKKNLKKTKSSEADPSSHKIKSARPHPKKPQKQARSQIQANKRGTQEERLEYYKLKYGEEFRIVTKAVNKKEARKKKPLAVKLLGKFRKKL